MSNIIKSISTIKNFMQNASRTTCNEYLYEALQDTVESMEKGIQKQPIENGCTEKTHYKCKCGYKSLLVFEKIYSFAFINIIPNFVP
ncbi:MAG: hypothetical protein NC452_05970 [Eubacterium sp.]|nr:hypothetical protein [Eubacterium sp.]